MGHYGIDPKINAFSPPCTYTHTMPNKVNGKIDWL